MSGVLDAKTIFVLTGILSVLISIFFVAIYYGVKGVIDGAQSFAWSYGFFSLFVLLLMLRGTFHELLTVVVADTAFCMCLIMLLDGVSRVKGYPIHVIFNRILLSICLVGFAWFTFVHESFSARVFLTAIVSLLIFSWILWLLISDGVRHWRMGEWVLAASLIISLISELIRAVMTLLEIGQTSLDSIFSYEGLQAQFLVVNLISAVFIAIGCLVLIQNELKRDLEKIASYDALTGVLTRRVILNLLEKAQAKVMRNHHPLALMMIDLDHFKKINDTYGHRVGDEVLVKLISAIEGALRKDTYIGRYGGEEFLVIMPDTDKGQLIEVSERIRQVAYDTEINPVKKIHCTISIGAIIIDGANVYSISDPVSLADKALYEAKTRGRNQVLIANAANH